MDRDTGQVMQLEEETIRTPTELAALVLDSFVALLLGFTALLLDGNGSCRELWNTLAKGGWWLSSPGDLVT